MLDLKSIISGRKNAPEKEFAFSRDAIGGGTITIDDPLSQADGFITLRYLDAPTLREINAKTSRRVLKNANGAVKGIAENADQFTIETCLRAIVGWRSMSPKALRALKIQFDLSGQKGNLDFTPDNVRLLADPKVSSLGEYVLGVITNYDAWFGVAEEEEEGNLGSGPSKSSPTNPVPSAS